MSSGRQAQQPAEEAKMTMRTAKKRQLHPGTLALSLTAAALLGTASPAGAQTTTTTETTRTQFGPLATNGCTETVDVTFDESHNTQTQTGPNFVRISDTFHDQGSGIGEASRAQYQFSSMSQDNFRSSSLNFSVRKLTREHLIRQGNSVPGDDLYIQQTILVQVTNGHAVFKVQDVKSEPCK
jgi:hypothetical protein